MLSAITPTFWRIDLHFSGHSIDLDPPARLSRTGNRGNKCDRGHGRQHYWTLFEESSILIKVELQPFLVFEP
jgi:hypothetical protein